MNRNIFLIIVLIFFLVACGTSNPLPIVEETEENIQDSDIRSITFNTSEGETTLTYEVIDDLAILEGDIILGTAEELENLRLNPQAVFHDKECGWWCWWTNEKDYRWPGGVIPYVIDPSVTMLGQRNIQDAMTEWEYGTSIRFVPKQSRHNDYVKFVKGSSDNTCSSWIGRQGGMQKIELTSSGDCDRRSLMHEIGHAIGLWHEQSRQDRNNYVEIIWDNVLRSKKHQFERHVKDGLDVGPYDYLSIMHYDKYALCKKDNMGSCIGPTIQVIGNDPDGNYIGLSNRLSTGDKSAVNWLYSKGWMASYSNVNGNMSLEPLESLLGSSRKLPDLALGDFNGDGKTDIFQARQNDWLVSYSGTDSWEVLNRSGIGLDNLRFGDFNGDGKTDVFRADTGQNKWYVSYGGTDSWEELNRSGIGLDHLRFGDFDGDGKTDVFRTSGGVWYMSSGGSGRWEVLGYSGIALEDLAFGDFDGDGKTDVFRTSGGVWYISSGGQGQWKNINTSTHALSELEFADFNGDGRTDIFRAESKRWYVSYGGTSEWKPINRGYYIQIPPYTRTTGFAFGDFNGDGTDDVFTTLEWSSDY